MWDWYKSWRHSKGFGVHSPYAYRFVKDVLNPGNYGCYAFHKIEDNLNGKELLDYKFIRKVKFIIRIAIFLKSKRIIALSGSRIAEIAARCLKLEYIELSAIDSDLIKKEEFRFRPSDFIFLDSQHSKTIGNFLIFALGLDKLYSLPSPVFAFNPDREIRELLEKPISHGLLLTGCHNILLIPRPEMAYVRYDILLAPPK